MPHLASLVRGRSAAHLLLPLALLLLGALPGRASAKDSDGGAAPAAATALPPTDAPVFPLSDVRPGLRGTAYTVTNGTHLETFEVEVIDVVHNFLPKQDVILVRCHGKDVEHSGIAEGMSGSPVFVDGKILGAVSYTWNWSKDALGGVTPIEAMLAEGERKAEGRPSGAEPPTPLRTPRPLPIQGAARGAVRDAGEENLVPIGTPLCAGGYSARARAALADFLAPLGMNLRATGGVVAGAPRGGANLDAPIQPGAALTVDLVRGDYALSALGTLTYVKGDKLYAFGHPFQSLGETLFPLSIGYVYTVVPSRSISFKMGAPLREVGALVRDQDAAIVGRIGEKAPMVPFDLTVRNAVTGHSEHFQFEITANRTLFQRMMIITLRDAITHAEGTLSANTKHYKMEVKLAGVDKPWSYEDSFVGFDAGFSRILIGLVDRVMIHPTERAVFDSVKLDLAIENEDRRVMIENVVASKDEAHPGEEVDLIVRLRKKEGGAVLLERVPVTIPADAPAGDLVMDVTGGDNVPADVAAPIDIADIPKLYDAFYKSTELVVVVPTGRVNLDMEGQLYRDFPLSAVPRLLRSPEAVQAKLRPVTEKVRRTLDHIVEGSASVSVRVVP